MKTTVLIVSDSHGYYSNIIDAIDKEHPQFLLHLGDGEKDLDTISILYPNLFIYNVRGNCDGWSSTPAEAVHTIGGKRIYIVHGNLHRVQRRSLSPELLADAKLAQADIVCYGHTHHAIYLGEDGIEVINPGTIKNDPSASYAVLTIENGNTNIELIKLSET